MKFLRKVLLGVVCGLTLLMISACGGGYHSSNSCEWDSSTPTKKFVTANGAARYYCQDCATNCFYCGEKATKNYTNLLDVHVFVCKEHYAEVSEN